MIQKLNLFLQVMVPFVMTDHMHNTVDYGLVHLLNFYLFYWNHTQWYSNNPLEKIQ